MEYGSIFGHGAYLGPDFTADYLHRSSALGSRPARRRAAPTRPARRRSTSSRPTATTRTRRPCRSPPSRRSAFGQLERHYADFFGSRHDPLRAAARSRSTTREQIHQLTAFFAWSAWAASARRPGPQLLLHQQLAARGAGRQRAERQRDRLVGDLADRAARRHRRPVRRLRALAAGLAGPRPGDAQLPLPGRRRADPGPAGHRLVLLRDGRAVPAPDPGRRACRSTTAPSSAASSGSTSPRCFPYNLVRTWHVQLAIFFVATSFLAAGIFLAPMIAGREPQGPEQARLRPARRAGGRRLRQPDRRARRHPQLVLGLDLRRPGLRVPRPRPLLAGPAGDRARASGS